MAARKPKYRRHTTRDLGFVEHAGKRTYFAGAYDSLESWDAYYAFLKSIGFQVYERHAERVEGINFVLLVKKFDAWAEANCSRGRYLNLTGAADRLAVFAGWKTPAAAFTPLRFKAFIQEMIGGGLSRRTIMDAMANVRFLYKWAVSEELIDVATYQALLTVPGLRKGRSGAKEMPARKPVPQDRLSATLPKLPKTIRAMVEFQLLTGARSQSICSAKPSQFDRRGKIWVWQPRHKTEHLGHTLTLFVGKRGQKIIGPFLKGRKPDDYLFQPLNKAGKRSKRYRSFYDPGTYRNAIRRGAEKANVAHWFPHLLRHTLGTLVREKHGVEAAQAVLGHVRLDATQIYAQKQLALAKMVARTMG